MFSIRSLVVPAVTALALSIGVVPAALAQGKDKKALVQEGRAKGEHAFPMSAAEFMQHVEKRIDRVRTHIEKRLDKRSVPKAKREEIKKDFEAGATQIRAAATKAGADGTVTKEEAKDVRELAKDLKAKAREKFGHGKGKGKGKGKPAA